MNANSNECDEATLAAMAGIDGEDAPDFSAHLASCEICRREIEHLQKTVILLQRQKRAEQTADLWTEIENRLETQTESAPQRKWQPFLLLGLMLVVYKLLELLPERDAGLWFKLVPVVLVVALFLFLKENPFKINPELNSER